MSWYVVYKYNFVKYQYQVRLDSPEAANKLSEELAAKPFCEWTRILKARS